MGLFRAILCILLPPVAVFDKGFGSVVIVTALWFLGWIPGVLGAMIICMKKD